MAPRGAHTPFPPVPKKCTVTGGMGFVGRRLVEMLIERGAERVVAFDIAPKPADAGDDPRIVWMQGDLTNPEDVEKACAGSECVWHIAALVGPYHPLEMYMKVNYEGTINVINACKSQGIKKIVMSSSPSTRFDGGTQPTKDGFGNARKTFFLFFGAEWQTRRQAEISPPGAGG